MLSNCNSGVGYIAFILKLYLNHECCCRLTTLVVVLASVSNQNGALLKISLCFLFIEVGCLKQSLKAMLSNCNSGVGYIAFILKLYLNHECCCRLTTLVVVLASVSNQNGALLKISLCFLFIEVGCLKQSLKAMLSNCNSGVAYIAFILKLYLNNECCCRLTTLVVVLTSVSNHFFLMTT